MKIVIIGGEAAGMSAAAKARRSAPQAEIDVYEMSDIISFGACGLPYFVGGEFDEPGYMAEFSVEDFAKRNIRVHTGHQALSIDPAAKRVRVRRLADGEAFDAAYDKLMIATGASEIRPPLPGLDLPGVHTLRVMEDGLALRAAAAREEVREVAIIGAGFIGLELAEAMVRLGKRVRLIQLAERVMPDAFDAEITGLMEQELREHGVALHLSEAVTALRGDGAVQSVLTERGEYPADLVVLSIGIRPNTAFAADAGLQRLGNGAIVVNAYGETSLPDIYAAGDCAAAPHQLTGQPVYVALATGANKLGRLVGENLAGGRQAYPGTLGSAAVRVLSLDAARTGLSEAQARAAGFDCQSVLVKDKNHTNYVPGQAEVHVKLCYETGSRRLLGAQMIGRNGDVVHRLDALAVAIAKGVSARELGMMDFCYAPPFARTWDVLNVAGNVVK
ncbi:CoA-disulfide reductase [Chromobacterium sp. Beijing]|uniref:CoA-disulfide reductase n=1 Tax=Chromobacterium sp. Beijing TaxID=2735795 RepID=UPI001F35ACC9|nr:CoA-disulfide reductase [Chromobacterium sp. Beijing]UJB34018.1 CoA-disulfide reductase [Chromobacterium sp. Beijing]